MPAEGETVVTDLLRGEVRFDNAQVDDQVLLKSDGFPTYHLANVVDDHLMGITHVIRAEEWLSSLPKHLTLYRGFGWEPPVFCHLPLLRNADRSKISKRKNPVSLNFYRRAGYLPEAMLNYLALMGWAMPDEHEEFPLGEFVEQFSLERISLGGPVFDVEKLKWLNGKYLRRLSPPQLLERLRGQLLSDEHLLEVLPLVQERIDTLEGFFEYASFFFTGEVAYDAEAQQGPGAEGPRGRRGVEDAARAARGGGRRDPRLAPRHARGGAAPLRRERTAGPPPSCSWWSAWRPRGARRRRRCSRRSPCSARRPAAAGCGAPPKC